MKLEGYLLLGGETVQGTEPPVQGIDPATGQQLEPVYSGASVAQIEHACQLADAAFDLFRNTHPHQRAELLETIAEEIEAIGEPLIERARQESGLPEARLIGERGRTCNQLRLFASLLRNGGWQELYIDPAMPDRTPMPRSDLRYQLLPLGPVAVFGASNFPLAFSVAGGDTASALAAGCPVVVKAHPAHPGTSELVGRAIQRAVQRCGMTAGVFALLFGDGNALGQALVAHPSIKAVGFTGSRAGGIALMQIAQARPEPVPVYAEMSSINPVILFNGALQAPASLAQGFVGSLTQGAGQFCTNPGLLLAVQGAALDQFLILASEQLCASQAQTMLTPGIHAAYEKSIARLSKHANVETLARGCPATGPNQCQAALFSTQADAFITYPELQDEVFGAASLVVICRDYAQLKEVLSQLEGQLTATLFMSPADVSDARALLPVLERKVGRILANGWPTGVEVTHAMVHGGPFPATSDSRTTSVGSSAIRRFQRPVCYQDLPEELLPDSLKDSNPYGLSPVIDGRR